LDEIVCCVAALELRIPEERLAMAVSGGPARGRELTQWRGPRRVRELCAIEAQDLPFLIQRKNRSTYRILTTASITSPSRSVPVLMATLQGLAVKAR